MVTKRGAHVQRKGQENVPSTDAGALSAGAALISDKQKEKRNQVGAA
jgi:hypothetical protein